jgi:hypothetical protein
MQNFIYLLIILLGSASYIVGLKQMINGKYSPSLFSRIVWLLLAVNTFAGVLLSHGTSASVLLGSIILVGNLAITVVSFWKGTKEFGNLEYFCIIMLVISGLIWIIFSAPLINLAISLFAHFIGALPTYKKVWRDSSSESTAFWSLFFFASLLSIFANSGASLSMVILPIYFTLFDGSIFVLTLRKKH